MKLDILVIAAHPDDAEIGCGGTIASHVKKGYKVGVADLTRGELGTRGTPELRLKEAEDAARVLGLSVRENLGFEDGFFENDKHHNLELIKVIRHYQPDIVLANAIYDRHTDHGKGAELAYKACFLSGLVKISTRIRGEEQKAWRPKGFYNFIQDRYIEPAFIVDITDFWDQKINAIRAFKSQFYDPSSKEPETYISSAGFFDFLEGRHRELGHQLGVTFGEGFTKHKQLGVRDLFNMI